MDYDERVQEKRLAVEESAELVSDSAEVWRGYLMYWKIHPWAMLLLWWPIRRRVQSGQQVLVREKPDEPNPLTGITHPVF